MVHLFGKIDTDPFLPFDTDPFLPAFLPHMQRHTATLRFSAWRDSREPLDAESDKDGVMKSDNLIVGSMKWGGFSNIAGGVLVAAAYLSHPHHETPEVIASNYWLWTHVLFVLSLLFGIFGLIALMGHTFRKVTISGLVGYLIAISSLILIFGLNYYETFINPVVAVEAPQFVESYGAGLMIGAVAMLFPTTGGLFVIGYVMFSIDLLRSKQLGRGAPGLMIIGVLVFGAGLSGFFPMLVVQLGSIVFGVATAWLGYQLIKAASDQAFQPMQ
ncbi:MAG: TMEM198/TM7SF3 family protein [Gammaproteobacteria bacterium]|nr:TMEM198/TM7SF3 family protein [Gammaproteobacteria bacterium]